ncbi:uncharacterized protein [Blastocystis hominis]|uniref:Prefoldin subunit 5 n=1 Tax=Blastocystis hominis TaxID=12968 RepID=D8MA12_BLAHO|nr:uncharacterized protein [Blastocystis hominis]CBK24901.2 unnamed protein product [Blastocystis hominis]|eukprot:XP_012898949.1 uncharacterized protein [Blastocystis hominis]
MQDTNEKAEKAIEALGCMKPQNQENDILIPVSSNILIPGKLDNVDHVYVSVGTGYVVEKTVEDATTFFTNQANMLSGSIKTIRSQAMSIEDQLVPLQRMIEIRRQQQEAAKAKQLLVCCNKHPSSNNHVMYGVFGCEFPPGRFSAIYGFCSSLVRSTTCPGIPRGEFITKNGEVCGRSG